MSEGDGAGEGEGRGEAVSVGVAERVAATEPERVSEASPVIVRVLLPGSDPNAGTATDSAPFPMPIPLPAVTLPSACRASARSRAP